MPSVLFIFTNATVTLTGKATGYYIPEAAHPYYVLSPHCSVDFASPKGNEIPLDPLSVTLFKEDAECIKWLSDETVKAKLVSAKKLSEVDVSQYDAIFYPGGHGPAIDLSMNEDNIAFATKFYATGKVTAAVCHGPAALVAVKDPEGKSIYAGKRATAFTDKEEEIFGTVKDVPFLLEDRMRTLGAKFEKASEPRAAHVAVDGNLITGQNPASAQDVAKAILKALSS
ncbi:DJ-1 protein-PfpI domain-containing protein [Mycena chlorophos]|uniref:D-lactate dehydratase n=1 Tax=Mycena chlorophos TaxID=658473 RepID=A0A8H6WKY8_MYCCL|nr:DJ-1 protein-PfpI domain-containing protein [Mycena chlorophos]